MNKSDHIKLILSECNKQGIVDLNQRAYILATVQHETANLYEPIDEYGGKNTRYAPYWGRGYVQLTWKANYAKYSHLLGKDFVRYPELVKDPATAAFILVHGFKFGTFTGRRLSQYVRGNLQDFYHARRCINGLDKANLIAGYAKNWTELLPSYRVLLKGGKATLRILSDTWLKQEIIDSYKLPQVSKVFVKANECLALLAYLEVNQNHIKITLDEAIQGFNTWYAYAPHIQIL